MASEALILKGNDPSLILTSGATGRISALFSLRALRSLLTLLNTVVLLILFPFRVLVSPAKDDHRKGTVVRVPATIVAWKSSSSISNGASRRAMAIRRVLEEENDGNGSTVRDYWLFRTKRGDTIFTQSWVPLSVNIRGIVFVMHGLNEHSGRYSEFAKQLNANGYKVYGMDWVGHGGSDGLHGYVHCLDDAVSDMKAFLEKIVTENPGLPCFCFGHSTGAAITLKALLDPKIEGRIAGTVLTSPAVGVEPSHPILLGQRPKWCFPPIWEELCAYWATPEFKKKSAQAKLNRASEKGGSLHTGGSISNQEHARRLARELGRSVKPVELHARTHTRKGTGEYVDERSRRTQEDYRDKLSQVRSQAASSSPSSTTLDPEVEAQLELQAWVDVAGGKNKGRIYGMGDLAGNYRRGCSSIFTQQSRASSSTRPRQSHESAEMVKMRQKLAAQDEINRQLLTQQTQMMEQIEMMAATQRELMLRLGTSTPQPQSQQDQHLHGTPQPQPQPPPSQPEGHQHTSDEDDQSFTDLLLRGYREGY